MKMLFVVALLACAGVVAMGQAPPPPPNGILVEVQFDNQLTRVQNNIKTVNKYMAEKLCRVQGTAVTALQGKDQSTTFNHQSTVRFFCFGDPKKLLSNCGGTWNRHQLKDEIKDHTTPDIEVQKVLSCTPMYMRPNGRKVML